MRAEFERAKARMNGGLDEKDDKMVGNLYMRGKKIYPISSYIVMNNMINHIYIENGQRKKSSKVCNSYLEEREGDETKRGRNGG